MAIADKLQSILDSKASIKQALINKGYSSEEVGDIFSQYGYLIENIPSGGGELEAALANAKYDYVKDYLLDMVAESYAITKDWIDYSQAVGSDIWFIPILEGVTVNVVNSAFEGCKRLLFIPNTLTASTTYLSKYFKDCKRLLIADLSNSLFESGDRGITEVLSGCTSLLRCNGFILRDTAYNSYFQNCSNLEEVNGEYKGSPTITNYMFQGCSSLKSINGFEFDFTNTIQFLQMFSGCSSIEEVRFKADTLNTTNLDLTSCKSLSHDSLLSIVNACAQTSETKTLKLGTDNLAKLSEEEKAIATNKGWTLA